MWPKQAGNNIYIYTYIYVYCNIYTRSAPGVGVGARVNHARLQAEAQELGDCNNSDRNPRTELTNLNFPVIQFSTPKLNRFLKEPGRFW